MATGKRYYWIKLRDTFLTSDTVDYFMSQKDGANYVVLYQMLLLKTANTQGRLERRIGEMCIPYDVDKIVRDCKWFTADTVRVALGLYKTFGLIYEERDGVLTLTHHNEMVGSETDWSAQKRRQCLGQADFINNALPPVGDEECGQTEDKGVEIFHTDIRYKSNTTTTTDTNNSTHIPNSNSYIDIPLERDTLEAYAADNLRSMSRYNMEELVSFRDALPDEVIRYAIDTACGNGKPTYAYTRAILNRYVEVGIKTIGDIKAAEAEKAKGKAERTARTHDATVNGNPFRR